MKQLHFHSVVPNPKLARAFAGQVDATLRPFDNYLRKASKVQRERQTSYRLPWEPVERRSKLVLTALDRRVVVPRAPRRWRVFPAEPDAVNDHRSAVVLANRGERYEVTANQALGDGSFVLEIADDLMDDDRVFWAGQQCRHEALADGPPRDVRTSDGEALRLIRPARDHSDGWELVLDGDGTHQTLLVDGVSTEVRTLPPKQDVRSLRDADGILFPFEDGGVLTTTSPVGDVLTADTGARFGWKSADGRPRHGILVRLLLPDELDGELFLDPRAAFCTGDIDEVWTQPRASNETSYRVHRSFGDRFELVLDRLPPAGSELHLPVDTRNLDLQQRALRQLRSAPLPHHAGLVRLCEDPDRSRWPVVEPKTPQRWFELTDAGTSGTEEQRDFVAKALGTEDLALLEGPPGSGKTTAICELVRQLLVDGQRVLLCSSTHVAIDNVIERLIAEQVDAEIVRIGRTERIDPAVQSTHLDAKVDALLKHWRHAAALDGQSIDERRQAAVRLVTATADLTCATTTGIPSHPVFREGPRAEGPRWEQPISRRAHWDVLVIDEASKTLVQEFMVPALMARKWIVVGDVHQLPPFAERDEIEANLGDLRDDRGHRLLSPAHQRAALLRFRLTRDAVARTRAQWLIVEPQAVLDHLLDELDASRELDLDAVRIILSSSGSRRREVSLADLRAGADALRVLGADWVLVAEEQLDAIAPHLPGHLLHHRDLTARRPETPAVEVLCHRHGLHLSRSTHRFVVKDRGRKLQTSAALEGNEQRWLAQEQWNGQMTWRLLRRHELRHAPESRENARLERECEELLPAAADIADHVDVIAAIGLPSIIEVLQQGIGGHHTKRPSSLSLGLGAAGKDVLAQRFVRLSHQHRMHPELSAFPRRVVYGDQALQDANTVHNVAKRVKWDFAALPARRVWLDVRGGNAGGVNQEEVDETRRLLEAFQQWAKTSGRRKRPWEVAVLSFYVKQTNALGKMLGTLTGDTTRKTRFFTPEAEIVCATVDRFQGREADLVVLSMRNPDRIGFLDSRNRLNVAITRARHQQVIVGNHAYFAKCRADDLVDLAKATPLIRPADLLTVKVHDAT